MADDGIGLETEIPGTHEPSPGDGNGDKTPNEPNGAQALGAMIATMGEMGKSMTAIGDRLAKLEEGDDDDTPPVVDDVDDEVVDLDMMSNSELVGHLLKEFRKDLQPLTERIQGNEAMSLRDKAEIEVDRLSSRHDDFIAFKDEMKTELEENGNLTLEQAYKLAKVNSPEKVADLAKKAQDEKDKDNPPEPQFGGLLPTSGITRKSSRMTQTDAALAAWDEIFPGGRDIANP